MFIHNLLGWLSTLLLTFGSVPQVYKTWKEGHSNGLSIGMMYMWFFGEVFLILYSLSDKNWPILANGLLNSLMAGYILKYKIWPKNNFK